MIEPASNVSQLAKTENILGITLPEDFRSFSIDHGAGYFGRIIVMSVHPGSIWYMGTNYLKSLIQRGFVAISDDQAGGFYGFKCQNNECGTEVFYWYPDESDPLALVSNSFYNWIIDTALI